MTEIAKCANKGKYKDLKKELRYNKVRGELWQINLRIEEIK